jgi:hypothetical protein
MVAMLTLGLTVIGAAVAMLSSLVAPEHVDPMGMFGLPPAHAFRSDAVRTVRCPVARPSAIPSRCDAGVRHEQHTTTREAA